MNEVLGRLLDLLNGELESAYFVMKKEYRFWFDCHWDWLLSDIYTLEEWIEYGNCDDIALAVIEVTAEKYIKEIEKVKENAVELEDILCCIQNVPIDFIREIDFLLDE
jgi:hypothetical protein